jgi:predicted AAA+ superfamily ATPase
MIPDDSTLKRFLKAKMNFFVYGPRASGKTFLLKKLFEELKMDYIYINCTMGDKKANFFRYLNHELDKFFKKKLREE